MSINGEVDPRAFEKLMKSASSLYSGGLTSALYPPVNSPQAAPQLTPVTKPAEPEPTDEELRRRAEGKRASDLIKSYMVSMGKHGRVELEASVIGDEHLVKLNVATRRSYAEAPVPAELLSAIFVHRASFPSERNTPWYTLRSKMRYGDYTLLTDFDREPAFDYSEEAFMLDLAEFPRDLARAPQWLQDRVGGGHE